MDGELAERYNVEICMCEKGSLVNISNYHLKLLQEILPKTFHHLICEFSLVKSDDPKLADCAENNANCRGPEDNGNNTTTSTMAVNSSDDLPCHANVLHSRGPSSINGFTDEVTAPDSGISSLPGQTSSCDIILAEVSGNAIVNTNMPYCAVHGENSAEQIGAFKIKLRVNVTTTDELEMWRKEFAEQSKTTMRLANTGKYKGKKSIYKARMRCQHNTRPRSIKADAKSSSKNTRCPAWMSLSLRRTEFTRTLRFANQAPLPRGSRSSDSHMPEYPLAVTLEFNHNHEIDSASVLRHRDVAPELSEKFRSLLKTGHHAVAALSLHKYDLYLEHGADEFVKYAGDRHYCPDLSWCYRLFYRLFNKKFREMNSHPVDIAELQGVVDQCKAVLKSQIQIDCQNFDFVDFSHHSTSSAADLPSDRCISRRSVSTEEEFISVQVIDDRDIAVAVCTPLMKRVHRLVRHSAEIVFVDVSASSTTVAAGKHKRQCQSVVLATRSCAGGLPLGVLIATSTVALQHAVQLYTQLLDHRCFFGRGPTSGPALFVMDNSPEVRELFVASFKSSVFLLSPYCILVGYWQLLWDRKSTIQVHNRTRAFANFQSAICSQTLQRMRSRLATARGDPTISSYPAAQMYIAKVMEQEKEWSVLSQSYDWLPADIFCSLGGNRGLCECAARSLKDTVYHRFKLMETVLTALDLVTRIDKYFSCRLMDVCCNRLHSALILQYMPEEPGQALTVVPDSRIQFTVSGFTAGDLQTNEESSANNSSSARREFCVDMCIGLCSCDVGCSAAPCRHQWAVVKQFLSDSWMPVSVGSSAAQQLFSHVATGHGIPDHSWFASTHPLQSSAVISTAFESDDDDQRMDELDAANLLDENATAASVIQSQFDLATTQSLSATKTINVITIPATQNTPSAIGVRPLVLSVNGATYEISTESTAGTVLPIQLASARTPTHERLCLALKKIEDAYVAHSAAMELAVNSFCEMVETVDSVEMLNALLVSFNTASAISLTGWS